MRIKVLLSEGDLDLKLVAETPEDEQFLTAAIKRSAREKRTVDLLSFLEDLEAAGYDFTKALEMLKSAGVNGQLKAAQFNGGAQ